MLLKQEKEAMTNNNSGLVQIFVSTDNKIIIDDIDKFTLDSPQKIQLSPGTEVSVGKNKYVIMDVFADTVADIPIAQFTHNLEINLPLNTELVNKSNKKFRIITESRGKIPIDCNIILPHMTKLQQRDVPVELVVVYAQKAKLVPTYPDHVCYGQLGAYGCIGRSGESYDDRIDRDNLAKNPMVGIYIDNKTILQYKNVLDATNRKITLFDGVMAVLVPVGTRVSIGNNEYVLVNDFICNHNNIPSYPKRDLFKLPVKTTVRMDNGIATKLLEDMFVEISANSTIILAKDTKLQQPDANLSVTLNHDYSVTII